MESDYSQAFKDHVKYSPGVMPDLQRLSMREAMGALAPYGLSLEFQGTGLVADQDPPPGSRVSRGQLARIYFQGSNR